VVGRSDEPVLGLVVLGILGVATVGMLALARRLLPLAAVAWGLAAISLAVALFFSYRYDTRVPGDFGVRRMYHYAAFLPGLVIPGFLDAISRPVLRRGAVAVAALSVAAGAFAIVLTVDRIPRDRSLTGANAGRAVVERVADVVPCGVRMLANSRSAGFWEATTGRRAVTEGMAPFLRPEVMAEVLPRLIGANEFFDDPQENRDYLARERVQYLVVVAPGPWTGSGGGRLPAEGDAEAVTALPEVHEVYRDRRVTIFTVGTTDTASAGGQPSRCPL
jgi:hypothetical protein